jgi:hypothetical protein
VGTRVPTLCGAFIFSVGKFKHEFTS